MARKKRTQDAPLSEPQTRVERYLAKTAGLTDDVSQLNQPRTRLERYLAKIAGLIEEAPAAPETRLERYLDAIVQGGGGGGKPDLTNCIIFTSSSEFSLRVYNKRKSWNGSLEWTDGKKDWSIWDGAYTLQSVDGILALRGIGNNVITGNDPTCRWVLSGSDIQCDGNIETLLDYQTVGDGSHPAMAEYCFRSLFYECASLISTPDLPATTLANYCYQSMFHACTSLVNPPALPATTLAHGCYYSMFEGCTSLVSSPALKAYTVTDFCYFAMFRDCTSLTRIPRLEATTLKNSCYAYMFYGCTSLKIASSSHSQYIVPFRIPAYGTGTAGSSALSSMLQNTGGAFSGTPDLNKTYYTEHQLVAA